MPPPPAKASVRPSARPKRTDEVRQSGMQNVKKNMPAATVDEVTADMSKDPRRERDEAEEDDDVENVADDDGDAGSDGDEP
jgi:hypothetical protein